MTAEQLARKYRRRAEVMDAEFRRTTNRIGVDVLRYSREKLTELIYSIPIPRTKSGKAQWRRTGSLRRAELLEPVDAYTVKLVNQMAYAEPRHEAGKPGRRATTRPAHWRDEVLKHFRDIITDAYHDTLLAILRRG